MIMKTKKFCSVLAAIVLALTASMNAFAAPVKDEGETKRAAVGSVRVPLNLAILIQDDLVSRVGNELKLTREFIRALPAGSRVMVGYITAGSLQVRQPFTTDLERAGRSLRILRASSAGSPYNPYVEVRRALKSFPEAGDNRNALLLISDGLDVSRGFDFSSTVNSVDLNRAIREAKNRNVAVYSFYAPTATLSSWNRTAASFGQSALNRISKETGGEAFFQGTDFVTFNAYFENFSKTLNRQYGEAY